jgi:hypothetical protein
MSFSRALVIVVLLFGCKKHGGDGSGNGGGTGGGEHHAKLSITVDGRAVGAIDPGQAAQWTPIGAMLPGPAQGPDSWTSIDVTTGDGKTQTIDAPAKAHPGEVLAAFPGQGGIALGFFQPAELAKKGAPTWQVASVSSLAIHASAAPAAGSASGGQGEGNGEGGGGENTGDRPMPTAALTIEIDAPDGVKTFTGDKLAALPTTHAPVGDTDTPGWTLLQILDAVGVKPTKTVVVEGGEGANLILDPGDLDPAKALLFIKLNRSGALRFRVFRKTGDTWELGGELRGVSRIELK